MCSSKRLGLAQIALLLLFLGLGFTFLLVFPFTAGPDEVAHFQFTRFIAHHGRLPTTEAERDEAGYKSDLPPLYHLLVGLTGMGINLNSPPFVKLTHDNPRLQLVTGIEDVLGWRAITTEDPYRSEVLLWYWGRWLALLAGLLGVIATYFLARACFPTYPWLALATASLLAFIPTYIHVSSVISYEPLLGGLLALYFLLLYDTLRRPAQSWRYLVLGLLLGLAVLAKYTPLPILPVLPLLVLWLGYKKWDPRTICRRLALVGLGLALPLGSWLLFTEIHFNQVTTQGWAYGLLNPFLASDGGAETSLRIISFFSQDSLGVSSSTGKNDSFLEWAWHLVDEVWGGSWLTWLFLGLWAVALAGLIRQWRYRAKSSASGVTPDPQSPGQIEGLWLVLMVVHLSLLMVLPLVRFLTTRDAITGMGQHILFPAGAILMLLLVQGLYNWLPPKMLTVLLFALTAACLWRSTIPVIVNYVPPWPVQTVPLSEPEEILATFGPVSLMGYQSVPNPQTLSVTLQWRSEALAGEDYRLELTLWDTNGQPQVRWLGQPLNGGYPTRAWLPGDRVRDVVELPLVGLPAADYQVRLRWMGEAGDVAPVWGPGAAKVAGQASLLHNPGESQGLDLGSVSLNPSAVGDDDTVLLNGQPIDYTLWPAWPMRGKPAAYRENATIVVSTGQRLEDEFRLSLVGPDGQARAPVDHTGNVYNFGVEPAFSRGDYRLRFEYRAETQQVDQVETAPVLHIETQKRQFQAGPISHPLAANFAGYVALLGYDLPERRSIPGGTVPVTLHWQALKTIGADLIMFNHLVGQNEKIWGGRDRRANEAYSTMLWAPGEIVSDSFNVQLKADTPDGIYNLLVGLYLPVGQAPVSLPLLREGQMTDITNVNLGLVKVGHTPSGLTILNAQPQNPLNQSLGESPLLTLLGYNLTDAMGQSLLDHQPTESASDGTPNLNLTLFWRCEAQLPLDYTTFVHLRSAAGETVAQQDQPPLKGAYPTGLWDPGEIIADTISLPLPETLIAGEYQLVAGLYDLATGARLPVPGSSENDLLIGRIWRAADGKVTFSP